MHIKELFKNKTLFYILAYFLKNKKPRACKLKASLPTDKSARRGLAVMVYRDITVHVGAVKHLTGVRDHRFTFLRTMRGIYLAQ